MGLRSAFEKMFHVEQQQLETERLRGERARHLLQDELLQEVLKDIENAIIEKWKTSDVIDHNGQFNLRLYFKVFQQFKHLLEQILITGEAASTQLEALEKQTRP